MKVFSIVGGCAGKTELVRQLVAELTGRGLRVSTVKRVPDTIDLERPGSGTWKHREAGAEEVLVASGTRWALMHELRGADEPSLRDLLARMSPVDLVLVEGYKAGRHRRIEVHRAANGKPLLFPTDPGIVGIACDVDVETALPRVHLDDIPAIAALIRELAMPLADVLALLRP